VTVSIRLMRLGTGFRYLMESVARGDGAADLSSPLTRYYAESGTPPGRFLGAGLAGVNGGKGIAEGTECTEQMLFHMLGECADPVTGEQLGRAAKAGAVAGFDLTFSVPKSISVAWAVADAGTQAVIYQAHQDAINLAIRYAERNVLFSRSGVHGIVQEPIRGVLAAAFDHWDSRSGDPQLHTHVVVQNKAQSLDGTWRTLDSRTLFKHVVTLSALHQGILQDLLSARLGWGWDAHRRRHSPAPKWEVRGVADELMAEFSQRTEQIEKDKNIAVKSFIDAHGRQPTDVEVMRIRQIATLRTRPDKQHRSLAEQTQEWRHRARPYVGDDTVAWVTTLRNRNDLPPLRSDDLHDGILTDLASVAVWAVADRRATFHLANLLAEIHRQLHGIRFADPAERITVGERTADLAQAACTQLTVPGRHHVPVRFRRPDGTSKFTGQAATVYTTATLLDAESRLLAAGRATTGPVVSIATVAAVADAPLSSNGRLMSIDQAVAVEKIATSGRVLDVLVGAAGTGKTVAMAALRTAWETEHGPGSVVGLAPSAAAAQVLADDLDIATENTARWLTEARRIPERAATITDLEHKLATAGHPRTRRQLRDRIAHLQSESERWQVRQGQLVIVDEASLAGTFALDELVSQAGHAGAKVVLVGDWAQLSAVQAGGAFGMLVTDRDFAPELTDVRRFRNAWEKAASIRLRIGDTAAIDTYLRHERIQSGTRDEVLDALYDGWKHDTDAGLTSLMIAGDADTVAELNRRARADRIAAGHVTENGLDVTAGVAGVGDLIVTRRNDRNLTTGRSWVKNGDRWTVTATHADGSMTIRRATSRSRVVLPADYVREHVELGYASTAHRAQGRTVDTAHAAVSVTTTREVLYVAATRGRQSNRLYVDTYYDPDAETSHLPIEPQPVEEILAHVLGNVGADLAAHTIAHREREHAESIATLAREYLTIAREAQAVRWDALIARSGLTPAQVEAVTESPAYGPLLAALRTAESRGLDVDAALPALVAQRTLIGAEDVASVLHERVDRWVAIAGARRPTRDRTVVGLIARADGATDPDMRRALHERAQAMEQRAAALVDRALAAREPWIAALGTPPADPRSGAAWAREARTVAAFRELHNVTDDVPASLRDGDGSLMALGDARAAIAAWRRAEALAEGTDRRTSEAPSTPTVPATVAQVMEV
jgi:conjugative relaxase-like TrwC/TraI family protein